MIVPDGVYAGQALMVRSPDGKQLTQAVVPEGCGPGQSFFVQFPTYAPEIIDLDDSQLPQGGGCVSDIDRFLTPNPSIPEVMGTHVVDDDEDGIVEEGRRVLDTINLDGDSLRESPEDGEEPTTSSTLEPDEERSDKAPKKEPPANTFANMVSRALLLDAADDEDEDDAPPLTKSPSAVTAPPRLSASFRERFAKVASKQRQETSPKKKEETKEEPIEIAPEEEEEEDFPAQKVLLVRVPPGVQPGCTIYVEIPGENRTVAAMVPEGVSSFHVCYTPRHMPLLAPPQRRANHQAPRPEHKMQLPLSQIQQRSMPCVPMDRYRSAPTLNPPNPESRNVPTTTAAIPTMSYPSGQQKLLLVRVPQGTKAGTTIHVSVPDEPGRVLAAVVPAGDVREFHVSYESRIIPIDAPQQTRSYLPPASPYRNHSMGDSGLDSATDYSASHGHY